MTPKCSFDDCIRPLYARGFCKRHYTRERNAGRLPKLPPKPQKFCSIEGCGGEHNANGLCEKHYRAYRVARNPKVYKDIDRKRVIRARESKLRAMEALGGKCCMCGYDRNPAALEFHHINPEEKDFEPRKLMREKDFSKIMAEISKCALVCKNCHTEIHHQELMRPDIEHYVYPTEPTVVPDALEN
jgi:hypothetical protein